jgi:hypothetical protein
MSISNRDRRRRNKQKDKRERAERARRASQEQPNAEDVARTAVVAAAQAFRFGTRSEYEQHLTALADIGDLGLRAWVEQAIAWWVERGLDRAWASGWQPADVLRAIRRALSPAHVATLASALAESAARRPEARTDERWAAQVAAMSTPTGPPWPDIALPVEALSVLLSLPPLPRLSSGSGTGSRSDRPSGAVLERVRALLAKAESTTFPEEAEALTAKAQELMARHAIDQALLQAAEGERPADIVGWRIGIEDPYAFAKSLLLHKIAAANGCRAVWSKHFGFSTVFGAYGNVETVEVLFTSLLVQATEAMLRSGPAIDRSGRSRTRSFRQSFLIAYATRIGERLSETTAEVVAEGAERHGNRLLPVLARQDEAVEDAVRAAYPDLGQGEARINNHSGWLAGRAAAEVASLSVGPELIAG